MKETWLVWLDRRMPAELRHTETKDGDCAHSSISRLEQGISCAF